MPTAKERPGSLGYWRFAKSYYDAAEAARIAHSDKVMFPVLNLYGVAIELLLKAFLLARGESPASVRKLGHGLSDLLARARRRKLGYEVHLTRRNLAAIRLLSRAYGHQPYELRYFVPGFTRLPTVEVTRHATERLIVGLKDYCAASTLGHR
jgi:HEPN domain-containing protein